MTERRNEKPPMNIAVADKHYSRFRMSPSSGGNNNASFRSIASSITFSDGTSTCDDTSDSILDPFYDLNCSDQQPGMPQRRRSTLPGVLPINERNLKEGDAAPCLPSRQRSVTTGTEGSQQGVDLPILEVLSEHGSTSLSFSEPVPEYLQPGLNFESQMKELRESADLFKQLVDIRDRQYGLRTFKQCFVGKDAVDRMLEAGLANDRAEAVELGRKWVKYLGFFRHVTNGHEFKDRYLFFEFKTNHNHHKTKRSSCSSSKGPWSSSRNMNKDITIVEGEPMSQKDLMDRSDHCHL